jgi:DNA-binding SARP family transcriptional activator
MAARIRVFGPLTVETADLVVVGRDVPGRKPRQLLQVLALHSGRLVSKERLADLLWGEDLPADPPATLEHYVAVLRRSLHGRAHGGDSFVRTEVAGYRLDLDQVAVDFVEFMAAVRDPVTWRHPDAVGRALRLSASDLFEEEQGAGWAAQARAEVRRLRTDLLVRAAEIAVTDGDPVAAAGQAAAALAAEPHLESAHRVLICAHYLHGDQQRALDAYRACRTQLLADLGLEPARQTRDLHEAVLRQEAPTVLVARLWPGGRSVSSRRSAW